MVDYQNVLIAVVVSVYVTKLQKNLKMKMRNIICLAHITKKLCVLTKETKVKYKLKKKNFRLPLKVKSQLKKLAMKNKVQVMLIQNNRNIKPTIGELKNGMLILDSYTIHDCPLDCVGLWNGKIPTIILPEWDLKPLSLSKLHQEAIDENRLSYPKKIILRAM